MAQVHPRKAICLRPQPSGRHTEQGYVLVELILALVIASLLAGLAMPWPSRTDGASELRAAGARIAVLLRTDRNAALRSGAPITTGIDLGAQAIHSGAGNNVVVLPPDTRIGVSESLAQGVRFNPDGRAQGGEIVLQGAKAHRVTLLINPVTAAVEIRDAGAGDGR